MTDTTLYCFDEKRLKYSQLFDPINYLKYFPYGNSWSIPDYKFDEFTQAIRFKVRAMKHALSSALESHSGPVRCLDLSTGSYIGSQLFLSCQPKVSEINCSDYLQSNVDYIESILSDNVQEDAFDWSSFSQWAFNRNDCLDLFKSKCKKVHLIDMSDLETLEKINSQEGLFQLITSEWAFCEGTRDLEQYDALIGQCNKLLEVGGSFVLMDLLKQSFWVPDVSKPSIQFSTVSVDFDWLRSSLKRNGFSLVQISSCYYDPGVSGNLFDAEGTFVLWATKSEEIPYST